SVPPRHAGRQAENLADTDSMLLVEFAGETGHGTGPTLEFYSLVCRELLKKGMGLWRGDTFIPAPIQTSATPSNTAGGTRPSSAPINAPKRGDASNPSPGGGASNPSLAGGASSPSPPTRGDASNPSHPTRGEASNPSPPTQGGASNPPPPAGGDASNPSPPASGLVAMEEETESEVESEAESVEVGVSGNRGSGSDVLGGVGSG
ncbi:unnamed protein product, partial [Laminaria digitata]